MSYLGVSSDDYNKCPYCGEQRAAFHPCPNCGDKEKPPMDAVTKWILIVCMVIVVLAMFYREVVMN